MANNKFEVDFLTIADVKKKELRFIFLINIDGETVNESRLVDIYGLLDLLSVSSLTNAYLWNCDCGVPDCANIEPCHVNYHKAINKIHLTIPIPCSTNDFPGKTYEYWKKNHQRVSLKLDKHDVAKQLWFLSLRLEEEIEKYSKAYRLLPWPTEYVSEDYNWPSNLPVEIRTRLIKNNYVFD